MTIFIDKKAVAPARQAESGASVVRAPLVGRLIQARSDSVKRQIRRHLLAFSDERLRDALGFTDADIAALRAEERC